MKFSNNRNDSDIDVSVVIPLFNKERYIQRALNSILNQTVQRFEIIVIDDGSTDRGGDIVRECHDSRIQLIRQENKGVSAARNRGIQLACAGLVAFLDADDEWKPEFLETIFQLKENFPEAGIFATAYKIKDIKGLIKRFDFEGIPRYPWMGILKDYFLSARLYTPFCSSSLAISKNVFDYVGQFKEGENLGEDLDMWLRIALKYPIAYSNSLLTIYHYDSENRLSTSGFTNNVPFYLDARNSLNSETIPQNIRCNLYEFLARHQILAASHCLKAGNRQNALAILETIQDTKKFRWQWLWLRFWLAMPENFFRFSLKSFHLLKKILGIN